MKVDVKQLTGLWKTKNCGGLSIPTSSIGLTGLLNVSSIQANLCSTSDYSTDTKTYTIPALVNFQLTANVYYYLTVNYNSGNPVYSVITDNTLINHANVIAVSNIIWENVGLINESHIFNVGAYGLGLANKVAHRLIHTQRFGWETGLALSESATRIINISSGTVWYDGSEINLIATNSTTTPYHLYYHSSPGVWTAENRTQYSNTEYDDNTGGLKTVGNNRYVINWIYKSVSSADIFVVLGTVDLTSLSASQAAQPPASLPSIISRQCVLVGRIIVIKNASTATQIDSAFSVVFAGTGMIDHNDLSGRSAADQHPATSITNTPSGNISSVTVQAAINELDTNKLQINTLPSFNTVAPGNYTITPGIKVCYANFANTVLLPASPLTDEEHTIVNSSTGIITIDGNGKIINWFGSNQTLEIESDTAVRLHFNATNNKWYII